MLLILNTTINIFCDDFKHFLILFPFIKYLWISKTSLVSTGLKSPEKNTLPFNHFVFHIINCKIF